MREPPLLHPVCYALTCRSTGLMYIGVTTRGVPARLRGLVKRTSQAVLGRIAHVPITQAVLSYGIKDFESMVLCEILNENDRWIIEEILISQWNTIHPNGYNKFRGRSEGPYCWNDQEYLTKMKKVGRERFKSYWADPIKRQILEENIQSDERKAQAKAHMKKISEKCWNDPEFIAAQKIRSSERFTKLWAHDQEFIAQRKAHASATANRIWKDPEFRKRQAAAVAETNRNRKKKVTP